MSSEILAVGAFVKGIYGLESNSELMDVTSLEELRGFTAVSLLQWKVDWKTLEELELKELHRVNKYDLLFNLVGKKGIDFTLLEVPPLPHINLEMNDVTLAPVPNVLIALNDSRHYMISKKYPHWEIIYRALEKGLAILKEDGTIRRFMKDSGFYRGDIDNWNILNLE